MLPKSFERPYQLKVVIRSEVATLKLHRTLLSDSAPHTPECLSLGSPLAFVEI